MYLPPEIVDLTDKTPKHFRIGKPRPSAQVDAIVLHQMAVIRGSVPENYLNTKAHFGVLPDGRAVQFHPAYAYLAASSAFNDASISIEFAGNFPNDRGTYHQPGKFGRSTLSAQQISGGRSLVRHLQETYGLSFIFAHRQGEHPDARGNCPGPDIWYHVGEWAIRELGMDDGGPGYTEGQGGAIPDSWRRPRT